MTTCSLPLPLPWPVEDAARIAKQLYLAPLVRLVGQADGAVVAYVGRERGDVYRLRAGQLIPLADETTDVPGRHDQGGWSPGTLRAPHRDDRRPSPRATSPSARG